MSAQSGKKRRLGSRRHGVNQSETSQPDELKDSTSVAQPNIPEENAESLNVLSNPDYSQLETKHPPSPELTGHKRKLGSSRRNKGRQHVKDPVTEQNDKPREEMEKNTSDDTLETTQMSLAIQPEKQTALCQGNEQDVTHNTHYSEGQNPSISEVDVENLIPENENLQANYSQTEIDSKLVSDSWKLVEITLGRTDKSDTPECAEVSNQVEENTHCVGITEVNSSSLHVSPTVDQQPTDESNTEEMTGEELHSVYSATHSENKEGDGDAELLRQDGNLQSNCLVSYSYEKSEDMEFSTTAEITTEKSSQKETFSSPDRKLSPNKEHSEHFNLSEVKDAQYSDDSVNKEDKQKVKDAQHLEEAIYEGHEREVTATQMQEMQQSGYSSESVIHDVKEKMDTSSENLIDRAEIRDIYQSEVSADESATKQEVSNPDEKQDEYPIKESNIGALDQRDEDDHVEEQTDTGFNPIGNRRKLGSSRRSKGRRHIKDPVAESYHEATEEIIENEPETTVEEKSVETMLEEMDKLDTSQTEEVSDQIKEDAHVSTLVSISEFTGSSLHSSSTVDQQITDQSNSTEMPNEELPDVYSITDTENKEENEDKALCQHGNLQGNYLVSESDIKSEDMEFSTTPEVTSDKTSTMENIESEYIDEQATFSSPIQELSTSEEQNEHFNSSEVKDAQHSQDSVNKENKQEVTATQMQEMQQSGYSSESAIHDVKEKMDTSSENLMDRAEIRDIYQSEASADESATKQEVSNPDEKQDEHPIKESNIEALDQRDEDDHVSNTKEPWISNIAPRQVYEGEDQEEEDIKASAEETVHQVKDEMLSEVEECESSSQTQQGELNAPLNSQPQHESVNIEEQTDTGFNPIGNRRKLGSSRRNKGRRHIKDPVAETYHEVTEEINENEPETTVEEKSVETMLEEMDKLDTSLTEEVSDQIKEDAHDMPNEDRANTENKERDEGTELLGQHGNLYSKYLVSESDVSTTEITTEKSSLGKSSVEKEAFSSLDGKLSTNKEQSEHFILVEVRGAQQSEEAVNKLHEQEVKPTQIHKMDQIDHSSVREEDKSSIHTLQSGMQSLLVSQPQDDSVSIQAQTHTGHTVSRRKMGSSRRHKERQLVKDSDSDMEPKEVIVNSRGGEMSSATETTPQEELTDRGLKQDEKRQVCSTVKEKSNTEKMQEEDTVLSENVLDNNAIVTTDITSSSDKDDSVKSNKEVSEKEKKQTEKPLVKIDLPKVSVWKEDSDIQSISYQGNNVSTGSSTLDVLKQEEAFQVQNMEAISSDKKLLTNNMMESSTENSGISNADDAHTSQQETQENSDDSENVQIKSKQKKRKMGSTRRTLNRKQEGGIDNKDETEESNLNAESDISNLNKVEQEAEVPSIVTTDVSQNENGKLSQSTMQQKPQVIKEVSTVQEQERAVYSSTDSNMITGIDDLMAFLPEQPTSFTEEVVNAVKCFQVRDVTNTETFCGTTESDEDVNEGPHNTNFEMKNASPNLNLTNRKRRMGSSRRNLGTISKREDQKQVVDNEATETNVKDVMTEHGIKEKELQLQKEHNDGDSEPVKEKVFETVERSRTGDSYAKPPGHQKAEENPVSNQQVDTEHHLTPDVIPVKPATSPKYDAMSESPHAGRRRKMGSHRKSHGHQTSRKDKIIDTETGRTITGESGMKTLEEHREESLGLDKKSEVIESDKKTSSNISITKTGEHSRPVSEKTPVRLGQESQKHLSLADNSNSYNVVMVGDSSVGKTSFMKRARSGKFSFDLPASVGLDSCLWTVLVEGKPVVLQLWDTAGQERFHSITRQIFHKAHAFLLMYDITSSQSFSAVRYWVNCIKDGAMEDVTILLLGNKSDCAERQVPTQQGEILAKEYNFDFMECSAATGENVVQSLEVVARLLSQKVNTGKEAVVLHKEPKQKTTSGCC
ncbi:hypothetical protein PAMA_010644 [Pampus argenteus]